MSRHARCIATTARPGRFVRVKIQASSDVDLDAVMISDSELNAGKSSGGKINYGPEMQE